MAIDNATSKRPPAPPTWRAIEATEIPPPDRHRAYMAISFRKVRRDLGKGLALEFSVHPSVALEFIAYFRSRVQQLVGVRVFVRSGRVVVYPLPTRRTTLGERPATQPVLEEGFRARLRADALVRLIVADAGEWLSSTPGMDVASALAVFAIERGDGEYGIAFNAATLAEWIDKVETGDMLSAYAQGWQGADSQGRTEAR